MDQNRNFHWSDYSPSCIIRRIIKDLPTILATGLIAVLLVATYFQNFYKPEYTASATIAVNVKSGSYTSVISNLSLSSEIAETFTELFESNMFGAIAKEQFGTDALPGRLDAGVMSGTNLMVLRVTADTPEHAYNTLRVLLNNYGNVSGYIFQNVVLRELNKPTLPVVPSNPVQQGTILRNAGLAGCFGMTVVVFLFSLFSDTVQTEKSVDRRLDMKHLGTLHHEEKNKTLKLKLKKANKGLLITMPNATFRFREEVSKVAARVAFSQDESRRVLLVTSVAENEGKSTVAANIALALAQAGKKVLLIDADFHKPALYKIFEHKPAKRLSDILAEGGSAAPEYLEKEKLYTFFSTRVARDKNVTASPQALSALIERYRGVMDAIIVDSAPAKLFSDAEALGDCCDFSLLVVRQDVSTAARINDAADALNQGRSRLAGCVFNDVVTFHLPGVRIHRYGYGYGGKYGYGYGSYGGYGGYGAYGSYGYGAYSHSASSSRNSSGAHSGKHSEAGKSSEKRSKTDGKEVTGK